MISGRIYLRDPAGRLARNDEAKGCLQIVYDEKEIPARKGDILIRPVSNSKYSRSGRHDFAVFDGARWRYLAKWPFEGALGFGFGKGGYTNDDVARIGRILRRHNGKEVVYRNGYRLKLTDCHRCGWCCIIPSTAIHFASAPAGKSGLPDAGTLKPDNIPCPNLSWSGDGKSMCAVHHFDWFYNTPCYSHKCELAATVRQPPMMTAAKDWYLSYYPRRSVDLLKEDFERIFTAAKKLDHLSYVGLVLPENRSAFYERVL